MAGEKNLKELIQSMQPKLHSGEFIFTSQSSLANIPSDAIIGQFNEKEGISIIMEKSKADDLGLAYEYIASWITLTVHSSLNAVGLTAVFSTELAKHGISCNVVSGYYHDHIFVDSEYGEKAVLTLKELAKNYN